MGRRHLARSLTPAYRRLTPGVRQEPAAAVASCQSLSIWTKWNDAEEIKKHPDIVNDDTPTRLPRVIVNTVDQLPIRFTYRPA